MQGGKDLFNRIAGRYDTMNRIISLGMDCSWRRRGIALIRNRNAENILDVATGTGDLAMELARCFKKAKIIGVDVSEGMMALAKRKVSMAGLDSRIAFELGDAMALRFDNNVFDVATCAFGLRNFPDKEKGLREFARVLKPGGTLLILELLRPNMRLQDFVVSSWLCLASLLFNPSNYAEYKYLRKSISTTISSKELIAAAHSCGLCLIKHRKFFPSCSALVFCKM